MKLTFSVLGIQLEIVFIGLQVKVNTNLESVRLTLISETRRYRMILK